MANKELKLENTKYAVINISDSDGDNTNSIEALAWFTKTYADKIVEAVDFGGGGGTGGGDVTREQFNNEIQARKDGDATLTANLNKEIAERKRADTTLQGNIDAEKIARENADTTLQGNIDAEKIARENADTTLTTNLNNEIEARTDGDNTLTRNLNKEIQDRENADTTLQNNIDDEVSARTTDIENVNTAITNEREARISADNSINQKLTQETNERKQANETINNSISDYWKKIYPIGSIYISASPTFNPQTAWGGTWKKTAEGRCLIGANSTYPLGSTGGSATHTHKTKDHTITIGELPNHTHNMLCMSGTYPQGGGTSQEAKIPYINGTPTPLTIDATGSNEPHNHGDTDSASTMQPYLAVYMWKRTA